MIEGPCYWRLPSYFPRDDIISYTVRCTYCALTLVVSGGQILPRARVCSGTFIYCNDDDV